jgi:hypothetical protein
MRRLILFTAFVSMAAGPASGEQAQQLGGIEAPAQTAQVSAGDDAASLTGASPLTGAVAQQGQAPAVRRPALTRRRRGSMVGYIDDSTIESKIRIRVDSGYQITAPDRAEFFYAKCGCYSGLPANHPAFDADAPGPLPGAADDLNFQQFVVEGEYLLGSRVSVFGLMPFRWIQPQSFVPGTGGSFPNQSGSGDLRAGLKLGLADTANAGVTAKFQVYFPTGDARKGMGTNHGTFEPALLFHNTLSDVVEVESQVGVWLPVGGSAPVPTAAEGKFAGRVFYYGIGPSFTVYDRNGVRFAPVVELVGWRVLSGNESVGLDASGTNILNLKVGGRLNFDAGSVYVGYGHGLTDKVWYDDILRLEYRYSF